MKLIQKHIQELNRIEDELSTLPDGYLLMKQNSYLQIIPRKKQSRTEVYITKKPILLKQLARKRYLLARKSQLEHNLNLRYTDQDKLDTRTPQQLVATFPKAYQSLPAHYFFHPLANQWLNPAPQKESKYNDKKIHKSTGGVLFQSKSEALIASQIEDCGLLYIPDQPLNLDLHTQVWPDFTILNPYNGQVVFWEHLGATHKEKYKEDMNKKMRDYYDAGYRPGENIIYTFEADTSRPERIKTLIENTFFATL